MLKEKIANKDKIFTIEDLVISQLKIEKRDELLYNAIKSRHNADTVSTINSKENSPPQSTILI